MRCRLIAAFALIAVGLSACTGTTAGDPTTAPTSHPPTSAVASTPTTSPPTTTSPTPTVATTGPNVRPGENPPTLPQLGTTRTRVGAVAFAEFWFRTWDWAYATTDTTLLERTYSASCSDCALIASQFARIRRRHQHFKGGRLFFRESNIIDGDHRHNADFAVDVTEGQAALKLINSTGKVIETDQQVKSVTFRLYLRWVAGAWTVVYKAHVV